MLKVAAVLGTRPEAIKLAPVLAMLRTRRNDFHVVTIATGQQREIFAEVIRELDVIVDRWLDVLTPGQPLWQLSARLMDGLGHAFEDIGPDLVIVQGDTQTAFAGAMTAALQHTPVAHVEAGLRSGNLDAPFPEELNRRTIAQIARLHFAPTRDAADNLLREGVERSNIAITGNTVIDTLQRFARCTRPNRGTAADNRLQIVVTSHRRESWEQQIGDICAAVRELALALPEAEILFILPLSPALRAKIKAAFEDLPGIRLTDPVPYPAFLKTLIDTDLVLTDSGGIQEEATTLGIPTVVMRNETDRPESLSLPHVALAGTDREKIVTAARGLLGQFKREGRTASSPFGDGHASARIVHAITNWQAGRRPLLPPAEEFGG